MPSQEERRKKKNEAQRRYRQRKAQLAKLQTAARETIADSIAAGSLPEEAASQALKAMEDQPDARTNRFYSGNGSYHCKLCGYSTQGVDAINQHLREVHNAVVNMTPVNSAEKMEDLMKKHTKSKQNPKPKAEPSAKQPGIVATVISILEKAKQPLAVTPILDKLCEAFPDRARSAMQNTIRGTFAKLTRENRLVVAKAPEGQHGKVYSIQ